METWLFGLIGATSVVAVVIALASLVYLLLLLRICSVRRSIIKSNLQAQYNSRDRVCTFTFQDLKKYSEGFSNRVGNGTTNFVYKGILPDGTEVAIKRAKDEVAHSSDVEGSFCFQVQLSTRVYHHHLVNLLGVCTEKNNQMLVFQYAPNGTLYENLHGEEHLSWKQRMRIAAGLASGLAYLHHCCDPPVIHGDFRSCNVFLTEDSAAKIGGLGKVPIAGSSELAVVRKMGGTVDPETVQKGIYSRAGDVYSFGVLLLELISGKPTFCPEFGMLVDWAEQLMGQGGEEAMKVVEERLVGNMVVVREAMVVMEVARLCIQREACRRPCMQKVQEMLEEGLGMGKDAAAPCSSPLTLRGLLDAPY